MATTQHHYVPRFYLGRFSSKPRRINLYNLKSDFAKEDVSLKDQCKRPNFYIDADIERWLSILEARAAECIKRLTDNTAKHPPEALLEFVVAQYLRTPAIAQRMDAASRKLFSFMTSDMPVEEQVKVLSELIEPDQMPIFNLSMVAQVVEHIKDLKLVVVSHSEDVFITSDNPVYFYNQYCEQVQGQGKSGARQRGLQIFMPLSPRDYMILYDGKVYDCVKNQIISVSDIDALNNIQVISAEANLYFSDWDRLEEIKKAVADTPHFRVIDSTIIQQFVNDDDENDTLIHTYIETPNLELDLSFLRIKKRALRIPADKRLDVRGREFKIPFLRSRAKTSRRYSKRIAKI